MDFNIPSGAPPGNGRLPRLYIDNYTFASRLRRLIWIVAFNLIFRFTPRFGFRRWRLAVLRLFGARIGYGSKVDPSCFVWAPWNLEMGAYACLAAGVDCYSVDKITIGDYSTVSQRSFLCTASHDILRLERPLTHHPITIGNQAWVCAEAFVGPGVTIGDGAVVGARAVVTRPVESWTIVAGSPASPIGRRTISD